MKKLGIALLCLASCLAACSGGNTGPKDGPQPDSTQVRKKNGGPDVSSEIGALNEGEVESRFHSAQNRVLSCVAKRRDKVPYLGGDVKVALRVKSDGSVRWAYFKESTLGDREAEECILQVVHSLSWPKPVGGEEGLASGGWGVDPPSDERPAVAWSADKVKKRMPSLASCDVKGGATVTMYVETDGRPLAVGVAGNDEKIEGAASCIVKAVQAVRFPSPGSWAAKVTVTVE